MDPKTVLKELGLSDGEIKVYLSLLKLGSVTVSRIKQDTDLHRTTIYDFIEQLLNKGLVNYVKKAGVNYYDAASPERLNDLLQEKKDHLNEIMPGLKKLSSLDKEELQVEIYKGKEGLKASILEAVRSSQDIVGIGIDESLYNKHLPIFMEQYQRLIKEAGLHERLLTKFNPEHLLDPTHHHYKFVPPSQFSPVSTTVFGNTVQISIWEPSLMSIMIRNASFAQAYRKHFEGLWKQEAMIFTGTDEVEMLFNDFIRHARPEEEWIAFGSPPISQRWISFWTKGIKELDRKEVTTKIIFDENSKALLKASRQSKCTQAKTLPKEHMSPAEVNIYGDKVAIVLWETPMAIVITNKKIAYSFKKYFELMWKIAA